MFLCRCFCKQRNKKGPREAGPNNANSANDGVEDESSKNTPLIKPTLQLYASSIGSDGAEILHAEKVKQPRGAFVPPEHVLGLAHNGDEHPRSPAGTVFHSVDGDAFHLLEDIDVELYRESARLGDVFQQVTEVVADFHQHGKLMANAAQLHALCSSYHIPEEQLETTAKKILDYEQQVQKDIRAIATPGTWETVCVEPTGLSLWYYHQKGTRVHSFRAECTLDAPLEHPMALAKEFDLTKTWNKYILESQVLGDLGPVHFMLRVVTWMPWPLKPVEILVEVVGSEMWKPPGLPYCPGMSLVIKDPDPNLGVAVPPLTPKYQRLAVEPDSWFRLVPLPPRAAGQSPRTFCQMLMHIDTKMRFVPGAVITFVLKVFAPFLFKMVQRLMSVSFKNSADPIPQRMAQHPEYYARICADVAAHVDLSPLNVGPNEEMPLPESWVRDAALKGQAKRRLKEHGAGSSQRSAVTKASNNSCTSASNMSVETPHT